MRRWRRWGGMGLFWLAALLLAWLALREVSLAAAAAALAELDGGRLAALAGLNLAILAVMNGRWWAILRAQGYAAGFWRLFAYRLGAFGVSFFTPGPHFGGEPFQVVMLARQEGVPRPTAAAAVALDKGLELGVSFSFLAAGIVMSLWQRLLPEVTAAALPLALGLLALPMGFLGGAAGGKYPLSGLWRRLSPRLPRRGQARGAQIGAGLGKMEEAVGAFCRERPRTLAGVALLSTAGFLALMAEYWLTLHFLGLTLTPVETIMAFTAARLSLLVPTPGALGAVEAGQALALAALGHDPALAISFSLISRARDVGLAAVGVVYVGRKMAGEANS